MLPHALCVFWAMTSHSPGRQLQRESQTHFLPEDLHKVAEREWGFRFQTLVALEACS